ncbi:hypothetical protein TWF718_007698 [Orbilia javanica]|uniref:NACHT domain-containing protein n=1 Tax=Orbilia javanica TaxID=47235 RepID=A0AAN8RH24_9PEZI
MSAQSPTAVSQSPFDEAVRKFRDRLPVEQQLSFKTTTRTDVEVLAMKLQEAQEGRNSHKALGLLRPFIDGLSGYAKVIEVFAQTSEILCFVWIGAKWQTTIDKLLEALSEVGEKLLLFEKCSRLIVADPRFRDILVRVYSDILELLWTAIRVFGKKTRTYEQFLRIHSPVFDKKLGQVLSNLENDQKLIRDAVSITHFDEAMRLHSIAEQGFRDAAKDRVYSTLDRFRQELQPALLSTARLEAARAISKRNPGAGDWLKNHPDFIEWKSLPSRVDPVLFLYGIPGAGKTTLSSIIFNQLENELALSPGKYSLAHLALGFQPRQNNDCNTALKSLLYDQLAKYPDYAETILEVLGGEFAQKLSATEILQELLQEILHFHRPVFLFIDGVDELSNDAEIRKFLGIIENLLQNCADIRLFISCRREELIRTKARKLNSREINMTDVQNHQDISAFVLQQENFDFLVQENGYDIGTTTKYLNAIVDKADGMFLYAKLIISDLPDLLQGQNIESLINDLPTGLDQAYERSLQRIASLKKPLRKQAKRVLRFLLGGASPLRVSELQQAVLVEPAPSKRQFHVEQKCSLGLLCGSLVDIMNDDTVCLVHFSLKEYLLEKDNILGFRRTPIHRSIGVICCSYLDNLRVYAADNSSFQAFLKVGGLVFLSYACKNLIFHLREGTKNFNASEASDVKTKAFITILFNLSKTKPLKSDSGPVSPLSAWLGGGEPGIRIEELSYSQITKTIALFEQGGAAKAGDNATTASSILPAIEHNIVLLTQEFNACLQSFAASCDSTELHSIIRLYGPPFRCLEVKCAHFYEGFIQIAQKVQHIASHRRDFKCPIDTCPYYEIGFNSEDSLRRHDSSIHRRLTIQTSFEEKSPNKRASGAGLAPKPVQKFSQLIRMAKDALLEKDTATASDILDIIYHQFIVEKFNKERYMKFNRDLKDQLTLSSQGGALERIVWEGKRQFLKLETLIDYLLFYGDEKVLNGTWKTYVAGALDTKPECCISLAILGNNPSATGWVFSNLSSGLKHMNYALLAYEVPGESNGIKLVPLTHLLGVETRMLMFGSRSLDIWWFPNWVGNAEVKEVIRRYYPGYELPTNILFAALAGFREAVAHISRMEFIEGDEMERILARMVSCVSSSSQEQRNNIRNFCLDLKTKGAPFWKAKISGIIRSALPVSLQVEKSWTAEPFLEGLKFCLDLGVSPTDLKDTFAHFERLRSYMEVRSKDHSLGFVDTREVLGLIKSIMEMGICAVSSTKNGYVELGNSIADYFGPTIMLKSWDSQQGETIWVSVHKIGENY